MFTHKHSIEPNKLAPIPDPDIWVGVGQVSESVLWIPTHSGDKVIVHYSNTRQFYIIQIYHTVESAPL